LVAEEIEIENQNGQINVEDDLGIKAEALYDYQAGSKKFIFILIKIYLDFFWSS